ncbi:MAG: hypothetical protein PHP50_13920 [Lachnospiraceae bacterium]|nr:hypothetical protein [Lachnospiraceae bacterium]
MVIRMEPEVAEREFPFGYLEVKYPNREAWNVEAFYESVETEIEELKSKYAEYERKAFFGENPYYRFFKKFKKTYPVLLQFESVLMKDRPFPHENPIIEVPFIAEIITQILMGTHDVDSVMGDVTLYLPTEKEPFIELRGEETHTYQGDLAARDGEGIIFSMIAGADQRTCGRVESKHVIYPVFGTPGQDPEELRQAAEVLKRFVKILAPTATMEYITAGGSL